MRRAIVFMGKPYVLGIPSAGACRKVFTLSRALGPTRYLT